MNITSEELLKEALSLIHILNALEAALKLKDETGCEVVVVTMGPPPAEGMLRELLARGADKMCIRDRLTHQP